TFSYQLDPATVSADDFEIDSGTITFKGFFYSDVFKSVTFIPDVPLDGREIIGVSGTITDTEGSFVNDGIPMDYPL
ncbi:MAG: hypothetical protein KJO45_04665, partial [Sulfurovum sp.]|nr:hypothetical protein [Sulfurovum sp.]